MSTISEVAIAAVLTTVLAGSAPAFAQPSVDPHAYLRAVDAYVDAGDMAKALAPLQKWSGSNFEDAIRALIVTKDTDAIKAAAVFQLELGATMMATSGPAASSHLTLGETLLRGLLLPESEHNRAWNQEVRALTATWCGVAASAFLSLAEIARAQVWIRKAVSLAPRSAHLRTLEGSAIEIGAGVDDPDRWPVSQRRRVEQRYRMRLVQADRWYALAMQLDASFAPAHIRSGRVRFLLGDVDSARELIERGQSLASDPTHHYLAALFLGALLERQNDVAGARRSYERALQIAPLSQTATVALAHLESRHGSPHRAEALVRSFTAATTEDPDWWTYRNGGLDLAGLGALRKLVRKGRVD